MRRKLFAAFCLALCSFAVYKVNASNNMVYVEGGTFQMGDNHSHGAKVHTVTVSCFYMSKYEVTQAEYGAIMGYIPGRFKAGDRLPVENVSWYDAVEYCNKRSVAEGLTPCYTIDWIDNRTANVTCDWSANGYRLPTEAEWEYAARGGKHKSTYRYSGSDNIDEVAWQSENSATCLDTDDPYYRAHKVGTKKANALGIYDMSGNVWEWCWDRLGGYSNGPETNPLGPASGGDRVCRGGSWRSDAPDCRCASRGAGAPGSRPNYGYNNHGFRVVRSVR